VCAFTCSIRSCACAPNISRPCDSPMTASRPFRYSEHRKIVVLVAICTHQRSHVEPNPRATRDEPILAALDRETHVRQRARVHDLQCMALQQR
jgi:hypothetical protein